ncbi:MAG: glycosyltransferase family 39 protein [Candidatus Aenigmarchaeota archaeon]|nr:glycosyltransferase family 39 protein [Candidatus Aenigmarchaeota archaeon]
MKLDEKMMEKLFLVSLLVLGIVFVYLASQTQMLGEDEAFFYDLGITFSQSEYPAYDSGNRATGTMQPLIPLILSVPFMIFGPSLALAKMIIASFGILTMLVVYLIGKRINVFYGILAAFILLSATLFSHYMMLVYLEIPVAFFSALATYVILNMDSGKGAVLTGVVLFLSFIAKQSGLFLIAGLFIFEILVYLHKKDKEILRNLFIALVIAAMLSMAFPLRNIILYDYPHILFLNSFFDAPTDAFSGWSGITAQDFSNHMFTLDSYISNTSYLMMISMIFSVVLFFMEAGKNKVNKDVAFFMLLAAIFLLLYNIYYFLQLGISEPRNIFIIFPQMALIGGFFIYRLKDYKKIFTVLLLSFVIVSIYFSSIVAMSTSSSQRYSDNYVNALTWLGKNTQEDEFVLTTYAGSVKYFAQRDAIWVIDELPEIMSTSDSTYIYDTLKDYNVSYILVWSSVLGNNFVVPESNLLGIFTTNFLDVVMNDPDHFNATYQNTESIIFELI